MTQRLYRDDPYLLEFEARVVGRREHEGRPAAILDRTAFYAESGGQPWDLGVLGGASVLAVVDAGDAILHVLDRPLDEAPPCAGRSTPPAGAITVSSTMASTFSRARSSR